MIVVFAVDVPYLGIDVVGVVCSGWKLADDLDFLLPGVRAVPAQNSGLPKGVKIVNIININIMVVVVLLGESDHVLEGCGGIDINIMWRIVCVIIVVVIVIVVDGV